MLTGLRSHVGLALLVLPWAAAPARAQCPDWQSGFQLPGTDGFVNGLATWNDGGGEALFVLGAFSHAGTADARGIARFDGTSFTSLGSGLALASGLPGTGNAAIVWDDGSGPALYVGGQFASAGGVAASNIARWNGSNWSAVGSGVGGSGNDVRAFAVFDDGSGPALYAGGSFLSAGGNTAGNIAKWNGSAWLPVSSGVSSWVDALAVYDSGSGPALYVGGNFTSAGGVTTSSIAKWDGTNYSALGPGLIGTGNSDAVHALLAFDDGTGPALYVGGDFEPQAIGPGVGIARWNGTTWSQLGAGTFGRVHALAVHDSGSGPEMYAGGYFGFFDNAHSPGIARWSNGAWSSVGTTTGTYGIDALASYDSGSGAQLLAGGVFTSADGVGASHLGRWNGAHWDGLAGAGLNNGPQGFGPDAVRAIARYDSGSGPRVVVAGGFAVAGPVPAHDVALWDGKSWAALGHGLDDGSVNALCVFEDGQGYDLYAGGTFITTNGVLCVRIARWNGSGWANLGSGMNDEVWAMTAFDDGTGRALYVSGNFSSANGLPVTGMARWNGTSFTAIAGGGLQARAMVVFDDGTGSALYAGGGFAAPGGPARIARRNGASWSPLGSGLNDTCYALAVFDDGSGPALYAAGAFTTAGGASASHVARWKDGVWSPLGGGTDATIFALEAYDDGSGPALYAGGDFTNAGGLPAAHVARWNGTQWSALSAGTDASVYALGACDVGGGPRLIVGGNFAAAGGVASSRVAAWEGCGPATAGISFCAGDGTATACPCGNAGAPGNGCANSVFAGGAHMSADGIASLSSDTVVLHGDGMPATGAATYFQGTTSVNGGAGVVFGDGLRCAGGSLVRLRTTFNVGGLSQYPAAGDASISARGAVRVPGERTYQCSYRNAGSFCTPSTFNLTNGQRILWSP